MCPDSSQCCFFRKIHRPETIWRQFLSLLFAGSRVKPPRLPGGGRSGDNAPFQHHKAAKIISQISQAYLHLGPGKADCSQNKVPGLLFLGAENMFDPHTYRRAGTIGRTLFCRKRALIVPPYRPRENPTREAEDSALRD